MKFDSLQIVVAVVVIVLVLVAMGIFTGALPGLRGGTQVSGTVVVWLPQSYAYLETGAQDFAAANKNIKVSVKILPNSAYEADVINSLAAGNTPDVWLLPETLIFKHKDKIAPITFASYAERTFLDTFIEAGSLYLEKDASGKNTQIIGLPVAIDHLVLYWNRDLLASSGLSQPPKTWDEFITHAEAITKLDANRQIIRSGAALGSFENIKNAKDIMVLLILQTGNPIINAVSKQAMLKEKAGLPVNPVESAVRFFGEFSNPSKTSYSWNRALPEAAEAFAAQKLGLYFGFASEYADIIRANPHLNFDAAEVPQIKDAVLEATFGHLQAAVISKKSANAVAALQLINYLTARDTQKKMQNESFRPAVRRDVLSEPSGNVTLDVFLKAAIKTRSWPDPNAEKTYAIFKNMVESTAAGKTTLSGAVQNANNQLQNVISGI